MKLSFVRKHPIFIDLVMCHIFGATAGTNLVSAACRARHPQAFLPPVANKAAYSYTGHSGGT